MKPKPTPAQRATFAAPIGRRQTPTGSATS